MSNANLILFNRDNLNQTQEHVTFHFVMREDPVSDELKAATIAGMKQRLEAKRKREARRRNITKRAVAAAAMRAKGKIYDGEGKSIPLYANPCKAGDIGRVSDEYSDFRGWRMYAPDLYDLIKSSGGNYRCSLTVTASIETDDYFPVHTEKKHFDFPLKNVESLFNAKRYTIGKKIKNSGAVFHFTELLDSDNSQTLVVEITPEKGKKFNKEVILLLLITLKHSERHTVILTAS